MKKTFSNCCFFISYICKFSPSFFINSIIVSIFSSVLTILSVVMTRMAIDLIAGNLEKKIFWSFLTCFAVFSFFISGWKIFYYNLLYPKKAKQLQLQMSAEIFKKATQVSLTKFDDPTFFNSYLRAINNSASRALAVMETFLALISAVFTAIGLGSIISSLDPIMILFVITNVLLSGLAGMITSRFSYKQNQEQLQSEKELSYVQRVFYLKEYIKETKITRINENIVNFFNKSGKKSLITIKKYAIPKMYISAFQNCIQLAYTFGVIIYLILKFTSSKSILIGGFAALINASNQLSNCLKQFFQILPKLYEHGLYINDYRNFMELDSNSYYIPDDIGEIQNISIDHVSFRYPHVMKPTLKEISMNISPGEKIALVGFNGAGKSTFINVLLGLLPPTSGRILVNDKQINSYSLSNFYSKICIIFQDSQTYSLSIIENILMRPIENKEIDENIVIYALKKVGMYDKIQKLPLGIYTPLNRELTDDGVIFSGGELQRIILARSFVQKKEILILDEPFRSLDPLVEAAVWENILEEYKDKIIILISHKLNSLHKMNKIYYIEDGAIIETGSHDELFNKCSKYAKMYKTSL